MKTLPMKEKYAWLKYANLVNGCDVDDPPANFSIPTAEMEALTPGSVTFERYLDLLASKRGYSDN